MSDQLEFLQADIDHLKEVLSSGQYNLDTSILLGVCYLSDICKFLFWLKLVLRFWVQIPED